MLKTKSLFPVIYFLFIREKKKSPKALVWARITGDVIEFWDRSAHVLMLGSEIKVVVCACYGAYFVGHVLIKFKYLAADLVSVRPA